MRGISLVDAISQAISQVMVRSDLMRCVFMDTTTPRFIRKVKQGVQYYTKHRRLMIAGRRKVLFNRMIASLRITDSRSVLA